MMLPDFALIVGAGWKPADEWRLTSQWREIVPLRTPELLWPLPGGETVLSRYVKQLTSIGIKRIYIGVGDPNNSPTKGIEDRHKARTGAVVPGYGDPVWTQDKIDYIKGLGCHCYPIPIDNPMAPKKCCWTTIVDMLEWIEYRASLSWDRLVTLMGDYVLSTAWLRERIEMAQYPEQVWLLPKHSMEFVDRNSVPAFRKHLQSVIPMGQTAGWTRRNELPGFHQSYVWTRPDKDTSPAQKAAYHDKRRESWCEVGPGEYSAGWALAEGDPI